MIEQSASNHYIGPRLTRQHAVLEAGASFLRSPAAGVAYSDPRGEEGGIGRLAKKKIDMPATASRLLFVCTPFISSLLFAARRKLSVTCA